MKVAIRTLAVSLFLALMSWLLPNAHAVPVDLGSRQASYIYDSGHQAASMMSTATERGPPVAYDRRSTYNTVDHGPHGASARPAPATAPPACTYDANASLVHVATAATTTMAGMQDTQRVLACHAGSHVAAESGSGALRSVDDVLGGLSKGKQSFVRTVPDEASLDRTFTELTEGGRPTTWKNFNGTVIERGDGVQVGMRSTSSSGGATVDIRMPSGKIYKIHVDQ